MPANSAVDHVYQALLKKGYSKGKAARIAQSRTGEALATGRPPRHAVATANEEPVSPGQRILQDLRQARAAAEAAGDLMRAGPDGVYECPTCHYRADSPRPHNCEAILKQAGGRFGGWSGFRMPR